MYLIDKAANFLCIVQIMLLLASCNYTDSEIVKHRTTKVSSQAIKDVIVAAQRVGIYHPKLEGKKVGVVVNQTSTLGKSHLVDTLTTLGIDVVSIFAPEHGFRGEADAGELINSSKDSKTGLPLISLYGKNKKPTPDQLKGIDIVVFDIQDVGVRFYTYISTLHYVMEACAEESIPVIVLDRPNPNAHYIDGPIMQEEYKSFVGMHPVPVVYGMTIGEYAKMINGEGWLSNGVKADLTVIECKNYKHNTFYQLPIPPSPNLPNTLSILLYPSLCFFEGTTVSVGRGTDKQFQIYGHPQYKIGSYLFTPKSGPGAKYPKHEEKSCFGHSLEKTTTGSIINSKEINLSYLKGMYDYLNASNIQFFNENNFFEKLAGTQSLRQQIVDQTPIKEIRASWKPGIESFKKIRANYLIYD